MNARDFGVVVTAFGMLMLSGCSGSSTDSPDENLKAEMRRRDEAHRAEIASMKESFRRIEEDHSRVLKQKDEEISVLRNQLSGQRATNENLKKKYETSTVVCVGLGAAVIGALFVGTLMGAKSRRDALRVCKERRQTIEEAT